MFVVLTADTITDEQIRELQSWVTGVLSDVGMALLLGEVGEIKTPTLLVHVTEARARCAAILNMRAREL